MHGDEAVYSREGQLLWELRQPYVAVSRGVEV